jgi:hypothetical protein
MPRAEISTKQAMFALEKLHAQLGGRIIDNKREAAKLAAQMKHVEAVLKLLDPTYSARRIAVRRRKPNPWFKRGTVFRHALDALRTAEQPLTVWEITGRMLTAHGVKSPDKKAQRDLAGAVTSSLRNHKGGMVRTNGEGIPARWSLA